MSELAVIVVDTGDTGDDAYAVSIGHGLLERVDNALGDDVRRILLVHSDSMVTQGTKLENTLRSHGREIHRVAVPDGEDAKHIQIAAGLWALLGNEGFTRTDAVIGFGGGSVTDLAGFVAATWLRGVQVIQVPTTLLGMVDAAVGGKTGINTAEGKNLVGAFHEPLAVVCDLDLLTTLPPRDLAAGMAEVVKCGFIADPAILELVERDPAATLVVDGPVLRELVERAVQVKADVVSQDLKDSSVREILNYGHTFGHAVEQVEGYRWRHGDAVSVGMTYAAELAALAGVLSPDVVLRHRSALTSLGLPTRYGDGGDERWPALLAAMRRDKKTRGDRLRFVVLRDVAQPERLEGPSEELLHEAYRAVVG
ncbi:3-dehydroquinate synthase [Lapillicoccus sp.]|uniref:3-dehydroquinate synthase n=1 Tax=Lapillicoccus sp. TaxID=1909287 RepID=UPI003264E80F